MVKRILLLITILLGMFWICDVFAISNGKLYPNLTIPKTGQFIGWNNNGAYTLSTGYQLDYTDVNTDNQVAYFYNSEGNLYNDPNGISFYFQAPVLITAYDEIKLTTVFCSSTSNTFAYYVKSTSGSANTMIDFSKYESNTVVVENLATPYYTEATTFNNCQAFRTTFTADRVGQYIGVWFGTRTNTLLGTFAFMGYEFELNGKNYSQEFANINNQLGNIDNTIQNESSAIQDSVNDLNNTIQDNNVDDPNFNEFEDYLAENGVITQLITLPVQLYTKILNGINGTCNTFNLGNLWGSDLSLPCIQPQEYLGATLWNTIDVLFSGFFIYVISKKMINVFEQFTNLKEGDILD